jgi:hypothetical protein
MGIGTLGRGIAVMVARAMRNPVEVVRVSVARIAHEPLAIQARITIPEARS